uniref:Uncharacterized protein n=1 Tax=Glossina palpalis gambiensis TaxID=67801 RepID=A0A1B0AWU0_9MUSC
MFCYECRDAAESRCIESMYRACVNSKDSQQFLQFQKPEFNISLHRLIAYITRVLYFESVMRAYFGRYALLANKRNYSNVENKHKFLATFSLTFSSDKNVAFGLCRTATILAVNPVKLEFKPEK